MNKFPVGSKVSWIARGKGARFDGVAGKRVTGTVEGYYEKDYLRVKGDYKSAFDGHIVPTKKCKSL